jgi:integrase
MSATSPSSRQQRAPRGSVVRNPTKDGHVFALRFTAYGERRYVSLGSPQDGWNEARAERELDRIRDEVAAGTWQPWAPADEPEPEQTFHEFSSAWFAENEHEWREATRLDYGWRLSAHLLPFFAEYQLSAIDVKAVDAYRNHKLARNRDIKSADAKGRPLMRIYTDRREHCHERPERPLSAASINKQLTLLGAILDVAVERKLLDQNPVKVAPRRRKVKSTRPHRAYLDRAEQIETLLDAAGAMDREATANRRLARRALLATLAFAGLRIGEALELRWRDVDLAQGRLRVRQAKTDAGTRYVDLLPVLHDELTSLRVGARDAKPNGIVFPSATGTKQDRNRVRNRILAPAIKRANKQLEADGAAPLPDGLTLHALRRTHISLLLAVGRDVPSVMAQAGHTSPTMTLGTYAQVMQTSEQDRAKLRKLVGHVDAQADAPSMERVEVARGAPASGGG